MKNKIKNIDIKNWKYFKIGEVFEIKRGKRNKSSDRIKGDIEYYSASKINNALTDKILNPLFIDKNKIIFTTFGDCFYIKNEFTASDEISILSLLNGELNTNISLFLVSILKELKWKYDFGRKAFENKFKNEFIKLPTNKQNKPDFNFMEEYIKNISKQINYNKNLKFKTINLLKTAKFKEFQIKELFEIQKGERLIKNDRMKGETPLITASSKNNGFVIFLNKKNYENKKKLFLNTISIDMFFNVFYQEKEFFADDNIHCLSIKNKTIELNKYHALFLISCLKENQKKYSFGRQVRLKRLPFEYIILPVDEKNKPDFEFMEKYIKSLPYSKYL